MNAPHLLVSAFLEQPLFHVEQMNSLYRLIKTFLPTWAERLVVAEDDDDPISKIVVNGGNLLEALGAASAIKHALGSATLLGAYSGIAFFLRGNESTFPAKLNYLSIEIIDRLSIEGQSVIPWTEGFFTRLVSVLPVRYAHCETQEEFDSKNLIKDGRGTRAVGIELEESIPGLYWLNYFGQPYVKMIGQKTLLSASAFQTLELPAGVIIKMSSAPTEWEDDSYRKREQSVVERVGAQFFFSKADSRREAIAPDFRGELRSRMHGSSK
jgi:hypothetical protein